MQAELRVLADEGGQPAGNPVSTDHMAGGDGHLADLGAQVADPQLVHEGDVIEDPGGKGAERPSYVGEPDVAPHPLEEG